MASLLDASYGWPLLVILFLSFRSILLAWVLPNYTPFYEYSINPWTMLSTYIPFSTVWHAAVPFPPKTGEQLVQGLLHQLCVEFLLIPFFTVTYVPFLLYVLFDTNQWTLSSSSNATYSGTSFTSLSAVLCSL